jgi:hypothetical protein
MAVDAKYFIGRGSLNMATRNQTTGEPGTLVDVAEVPEIEVIPGVERAENMNTSRPIAVKDLSVVKSMSLGIRIVLKEVTPANIAVMGFGTVVAEGSGVFTDQALPSGLIVGDRVRLPGARTMVSSVVVKDSAGSPATLTLNTHYEIDTSFGIIKILSLGTFVQPFTVSGTEATGKTSVPFLTTRQVEKYLLFTGYNLGNDDRKCIFEIYRASLSPTSSFALKSDEVVSFELTGECLSDATKGIDPTYGNYARYRELE